MLFDRLLCGKCRVHCELQVASYNWQCTQQHATNVHLKSNGNKIAIVLQHFFLPADSLSCAFTSSMCVCVHLYHRMCTFLFACQPVCLIEITTKLHIKWTTVPIRNMNYKKNQCMQLKFLQTPQEYTTTDTLSDIRVAITESPVIPTAWASIIRSCISLCKPYTYSQRLSKKVAFMILKFHLCQWIFEYFGFVVYKIRKFDFRFCNFTNSIYIKRKGRTILGKI